MERLKVAPPIIVTDSPQVLLESYAKWNADAPLMRDPLFDNVESLEKAKYVSPDVIKEVTRTLNYSVRAHDSGVMNKFWSKKDQQLKELLKVTKPVPEEKTRTPISKKYELVLPDLAEYKSVYPVEPDTISVQCVDELNGNDEVEPGFNLVNETIDEAELNSWRFDRILAPHPVPHYGIAATVEINKHFFSIYHELRGCTSCPYAAFLEFYFKHSGYITGITLYSGYGPFESSYLHNGIIVPNTITYYWKQKLLNVPIKLVHEICDLNIRSPNIIMAVSSFFYKELRMEPNKYMHIPMIYTEILKVLKKMKENIESVFPKLTTDIPDEDLEPDPFEKRFNLREILFEWTKVIEVWEIGPFSKLEKELISLGELILLQGKLDGLPHARRRHLANLLVGGLERSMADIQIAAEKDQLEKRIHLELCSEIEELSYLIESGDMTLPKLDDDPQFEFYEEIEAIGSDADADLFGFINDEPPVEDEVDSIEEELNRSNPSEPEESDFSLFDDAEPTQEEYILPDPEVQFFEDRNEIWDKRVGGNSISEITDKG
jgi:hypothetical protein